MDPLGSLDIGSGSPKSPLKPSPSSLTSPGGISSQAFANLTAQSISRPASSQRSTPGLIGATKTPVNDSFSSLLSLGSGKTATNVTLQERQKQLIEERRRQIDEQQKRQQNDLNHLDSLGSGTTGRVTPVPGLPATNGIPKLAQANDKVGDILAAFDSSAQGNKNSGLPVRISSPASNAHTPIAAQNGLLSGLANASSSFDEDDDPFGLNSMPKRTTGTPQQATHADDGDDILGDLGKPVQERKAPNGTSGESRDTGATAEPSEDRGVAELVDMGFSTDRARQALDATGHDMQAAVGWLLSKAHEESKAKSRPAQETDGRRGRSPRHRRSSSRSRRRSGAQDETVPAWMRPRSRSGQARRKNSGSANKEKDVAQFATEIGTAFFKSANTLWKQGQKKVQKAVAEFQHEGELSQPKWMREVPGTDEAASPAKQRDSAHPKRQAASTNVTNEALLLESDNTKPVRQAKPSASPAPSSRADMPERRTASPQPISGERRAPSAASHTSRAASTTSTSRSRRFDDDIEAASVYVSSARRRRPPAQPAMPEVDLFSAPPAGTVRSSSAQKPVTPSPAPSKVSPAHAQSRSPRAIPDLSAADRLRSGQHRKAGTEAYKRGDYAAAHESFTAALAPLPSSHPVAIIVFCNHAMTALKIGDAKEAIADADRALNIIGPGKGDGEVIDLGDSEPAKPMKDFYGKALTRKAEALESREQWLEAGRCWRLCVESGLGGAVSTQGRDRCERAVKTALGSGSVESTTATSSTSTKTSRKPPPATTTTAQHRSASTPASSAAADAAVRALRAQTAKAERTDDEKFALSDGVDARIAGWKGGKADNLRGLLASLDTVLWESAGWKKCSMAELVLVPRVKVIYMKAIAKVHPDKISLDATTEQRMISSSVFSTLNEAWDKFKRDNGL